MPLEENWNSETKQIWEEVEALGKEKEWDTIEIHRAFIRKLDEKEGKKKEKNKLINLPVEAKETRAAPNSLIRSALFGIVERGKRADLKDAVIAAQNGYELTYTGERLDQTDFDVWLAIKHLCFPYPLGTEITITAPELLKVLQRKDGKATRKWLIKSLKRMTECSVGIRTEKQWFIGHIIEHCKWDEDNYVFAVSLSNKTAHLFEDKSYTLLNAADRNKLGKELTRWLHAYWASHNEIYPIKDTKLQTLCGSKASKDQFRRALRLSLKELENIGFIETESKVERNGTVIAKKISKKLIGFSKRKD